jgi:hypothetical protein
MRRAVPGFVKGGVREAAHRASFATPMVNLILHAAFSARSGIGPVLGGSTDEQRVPIEIEDKPTAVTIMRELVEQLQDTTEALKREIVRNPKSDEYRKALKGAGDRLTIAKQILAREEARASHSL